MGLKKDYYYAQNIGVTMQTAYAVLKDLILNGNYVRAIFVIQSSRDSAQRLQPIETVEIGFKWDRKTDIAKLAYEKAKTQTIKHYEYDGKSDKPIEIETKGLLYGWDNDIVE